VHLDFGLGSVLDWALPPMQWRVQHEDPRFSWLATRSATVRPKNPESATIKPGWVLLTGSEVAAGCSAACRGAAHGPLLDVVGRP
jgi:hypothetical protein